MTTQSILKAGVLTALIGIGPVAASAATAPPVTHSTSVSLSDIDLSTAEGRRTARDRLHETARQLCAQVADSQDLSHQANFVACVDDTLTKALRQLDAPTHMAVAEKGATWGIAAAPAAPKIAAQKTPVPEKTRATTVWLGDLDLSTAEGMRIARGRVHEAARRLCEQVSDPDDRSRQSHFVDCVDESTSAALRQLPGPALAAAQMARQGGATP
jgi:UrcA family protein